MCAADTRRYKWLERLKVKMSTISKILKVLDPSRRIELYFKWHGAYVSRHPVFVIVISFLLTLLCTVGLLNFQWESNAMKLWIPEDSDFAHNYNWLWQNHPPDMRLHSVIFTANGENILQPKFIQQMYAIRKNIFAVNVENETWNDVCFRIPVVDVSVSSLFSRRRRDAFEDAEFEDDLVEVKELDPSVEFYPKPYCGILERMDTTCFEESVLELWANRGKYDEKSDQVIAELTEEEILHKVNHVNTSGLYLLERDFQSLLGGKVYDDDGRIVSANALYMKLIGRMDGEAALKAELDQNNALGEYVDKKTLKFENEIIKVLLNATDDDDDFRVFANIARSFSDIASETVFSDVFMVGAGFMIMFIYVQLNLGKFDYVEHRSFLSTMGLVSIGGAIFASAGVCCSLGYRFTPMHNFIPFLLLGLGVDDMFVIVQSWNNLSADDKSTVLHEKFAKTMKHAGVAITVTSLTDFISFAIGGTTVLPALRSFCVFCGFGILVVYLLQATWFLAWMTIDQRRIQDLRNGWLPCYKHKPNTNTAMCGKAQKEQILKRAFRRYGNTIVKVPVKVTVILVTVVIFCLSVCGNIRLKQEFDPMWFLPRDSYVFQWGEINDKYFPSQGEQVHVFVTDLDLPNELANLDYFISEMESHQSIVAEVDSWYIEFKTYYNKHFKKGPGLPHETLDTQEFNTILTQFLFSPSGAKYRVLFRFDDEIKCGTPAPNVTMFTLQFRHRLFAGPKERIPAMNTVKRIIRDANFSGMVFPFSRGYAAWETDEVISEELYRNLGLAFACIGVTTLILLSNVVACVEVLVCVVMTLVNVAGFMHFWGLTIETISCTNLVICIGISVDCAAHIAHEFLSVTGSRDERIGEALTNMGPAVLNGGFSTFLSFILLANSNSHVFDTFFRIFFLVVIFALFNGLVFLPVVLSLLGPKPRHDDDKSSSGHAAASLKIPSSQAKEPMELETLKS